MKKYFAKYLPVEGKGDTGCKWQWKNNIKNTGWEDISRSDMDAIIAHGLEPKPEFRKLKLCLCSRDIQEGDKVYYKNELAIVTHKEEKSDWLFISPDPGPSIDPMELTKVIGQISPEAKWVKEGDEFDEKDLLLFEYPEGLDEKDFWVEWDWKNINGLLENVKLGSSVLVEVIK